MIKYDYNKSKYDDCVYIRGLNIGYFIYLLLYVDAMLIATNNKIKINKLKKLLNGESKMKDLGMARKILGIEIRKDRKAGKLFLSQ